MKTYIPHILWGEVKLVRIGTRHTLHAHLQWPRNPNVFLGVKRLLWERFRK